MDPASTDDRILSLENKLNSLTIRLVELERRLSALERGSWGQLPKPSPTPKPAEVKQVYLRRAISTARREYERKGR